MGDLYPDLNERKVICAALHRKYGAPKNYGGNIR